VLDIFGNVRALAYADDLKLYMRVSSTDDCRLFQYRVGVVRRSMTWMLGSASPSRFSVGRNRWSFNRGGLGSKSLSGKRFYKGLKYIAEKASNHFKKALIPLKMYLKSLAIFEKASISLKKSSTIVEIFIKAPNF
jgi:hypothetical protein